MKKVETIRALEYCCRKPSVGLSDDLMLKTVLLYDFWADLLPYTCALMYSCASRFNVFQWRTDYFVYYLRSKVFSFGINCFYLH